MCALSLRFSFCVESRSVIRDVPRGGVESLEQSLSRMLGRAVALKLRSCHDYAEQFGRSISGSSSHGRRHGNRISRPWYTPTPLHDRYVPNVSLALFVASRCHCFHGVLRQCLRHKLINLGMWRRIAIDPKVLYPCEGIVQRKRLRPLHRELVPLKARHAHERPVKRDWLCDLWEVT